VIRDIAVMLADGGDCVSDIGALGDQASLFGVVALASTTFRFVDRIADDRADVHRAPDPPQPQIRAQGASANR
jgi:hypothetical protein